MSHVWIVQCLCGPNRHCITGLAGEFGSEDEAKLTLLTQLAKTVAVMLEEGVNPWCAICGADAKGWRHEVGRTRFATMKEAAPHLAKSQLENLLTNMVLGTHGPTPPKRQ